MAGTKARILSFLKSSPGRWVSGEQMSREMGVTRSALWKQIASLRREGYGIEASSRRGYLLRKVADSFLVHEIQDGLATRSFGKGRVVVFPETDSTNQRAKELAAGGAAEGTIVLAEKQTRGRGRRGRSWFSPPGEGLYCSLVLRPGVAPAEGTGVTLTAAVAAADSLIAETSLPIRLKWPNDLLVHGRKLGGILTEVGADMDVIDYMVVGLGLNVNVPPQNFPPEIAQRATSLLMETGRTFSRVRLLQGYLAGLERLYATFRDKGFAPVLGRWKELAGVVGKEIRVEDPAGKQMTGKVTDVDVSGALILRGARGDIRRIVSGDVTLVETPKVLAAGGKRR